MVGSGLISAKLEPGLDGGVALPLQFSKWEDGNNRDVAEADIWEAVFRYQFENNASGGNQGVETYFLSVRDNEDPDPEFMKRFDGHIPFIEPVTASTSLESCHYRVIDKKDGKDGMIFRITSVEWVDDDIAEVEGGSYSDALGASGNTYRVERRGKWFVTGHVMNWKA